jgi:hypothetical protein
MEHQARFVRLQFPFKDFEWFWRSIWRSKTMEHQPDPGRD